MKANLSENIDPANCEKCGGQCCKYFGIWYSDDCDPVVISEAQRIMSLKNIGLYCEIIHEDSNKGFWLRINDVCKFLGKNGKCKIYDSPSRPLLCRLFPYSNSTKTDCPHITKRREP